MTEKLSIEFIDEIKKELKDVMKIMLVDTPFKTNYDLLRGEDRAYIKILDTAGYTIDLDIMINDREEKTVDEDSQKSEK